MDLVDVHLLGFIRGVVGGYDLNVPVVWPISLRNVCDGRNLLRNSPLGLYRDMMMNVINWEVGNNDRGAHSNVFRVCRAHPLLVRRRHG